MSGASIWDRFTHDPRHEQNARLRASDRDRDVVNDVLGTAYAEGRLTPDELDERTDKVTHSKTLGELSSIIDDLVAVSSSTPVLRDRRVEAESRYRQQRSQALVGFLVPTLICWAIWLGTPSNFPWPIFVMIGTGIRLLQLLTTREDVIRSIERNLAKKERRTLEERQRQALETRQPPPQEPDEG